MVKTPSMDISVNFGHDQEDECVKCLDEIMDIIDDTIDIETRTYDEYDIDNRLEDYEDGYYFNIYISLKEQELIRKVIEKVLEYSPT